MQVRYQLRHSPEVPQRYCTPDPHEKSGPGVPWKGALTGLPGDGTQMLRFLPYLLELVLVVYCVIDVVRTPDGDCRTLPRWGWLLLVILVPIVGSVAWLVAGRPRRDRQRNTWEPGRRIPPRTTVRPQTPATRTKPSRPSSSASTAGFEGPVRRKAAEQPVRAERPEPQQPQPEAPQGTPRPHRRDRRLTGLSALAGIRAHRLPCAP